jgi:hypothetical protein
VKNFGTRDLRHANLPDRDDVLLSPPTSPARNGAPLPPLSRSPPSTAPALPPRKTPTGGGVLDGPRAVSPTSPIFRPTHTYTPVRPMSIDQTKSNSGQEEAKSVAREDEDWEPPVVTGGAPHTGRGTGGLPRTVPLGTAMQAARSVSPVRPAALAGRSGSDDEGLTKDTAAPSATMTVPLAPVSTGVRYGAALGGRATSAMSPMSTGKQWGGGTPVCPKCQKTVYFAEQVQKCCQRPPFPSSCSLCIVNR